MFNYVLRWKKSFKTRKKIDDTTIKGITNLFRLKKENDVIKGRIIRDIRNLFEHIQYYYEPQRAGNFWSNNYIEYENNSDN